MGDSDGSEVGSTVGTKVGSGDGALDGAGVGVVVGMLQETPLVQLFTNVPSEADAYVKLVLPATRLTHGAEYAL